MSLQKFDKPTAKFHLQFFSLDVHQTNTKDGFAGSDNFKETKRGEICDMIR